MDNNTGTQETLNPPVTASSAATDTNTQAARPAEASPSPVATTDKGPSDAKQTAGTSAADDQDANKRATLLDVVKAAYNKGKPDAKSSTAEDKTESAKPENAETQGSRDDDQAPKDDQARQAEKEPFHNHPRWKEMISERDALKPRAEQFDKITTFMRDAGLSAKEMADGMQVMAMMKTNPQEAYKALQGYVSQLAPLVGEVLPEDLKGRVDNGFVDAETAKELAVLKAEREFALRRHAELEARKAEDERNRQEAEAAERSRSIVQAVSKWEETEKAKDPDWSAKYEMVQDRVVALLATERPSSPSDAIELARRALADVNSRLRPYAGRNVALKGPSSSQSSANSRPAPRTLFDAISSRLNP